VPGGWSIAVEMFFYMIAPALVFICRTTRGLIAVSMVVVTVVAYAGARLTARRIEEPCSRWAREWLDPMQQARRRR
jgi:peptidoglycan/LPS O-acetylase OafA/YrhL